VNFELYVWQFEELQAFFEGRLQEAEEGSEISIDRQRGRIRNCQDLRTEYFTDESCKTHTKVLHGVLYPEAHGNGFQKQRKKYR
jgi:hypothetical protein